MSWLNSQALLSAEYSVLDFFQVIQWLQAQYQLYLSISGANMETPNYTVY